MSELRPHLQQMSNTYRPPTDEAIINSLPIHDHLGLTEDNLAEICRGLWDCDPVMQRYKDRAAELEENIIKYNRKEDEARAEVNRLEGEEDRLLAEAKRINTLKREARGAAVSWDYQAKLARTRIRECDVSCTKRKKQLYLSEAQRRLKALGKQLKMGRGNRARDGHNTAVVPLTPTT